LRFSGIGQLVSTDRQNVLNLMRKTFLGMDRLVGKITLTVGQFAQFPARSRKQPYTVVQGKKCDTTYHSAGTDPVFCRFR